MPGPRYEVYIQDLTLTSPGGTDTLKCGYTWNTTRQVDDQLALQYSVNGGNPINFDTVNGATKKTYTPADVTPAGGGATPTYTVELLTKHNDNGTLTQKVVDSIEIKYPNGTQGGIVGDPRAKKLNKTKFYLLVRTQGQNNDTADYTMTLGVMNQGTGNFDPQGGINVPANATTFHTYLSTLDQATYIFNLQGADAARIQYELLDNQGNTVNSTTTTVLVQSVEILPAPGPQNGSLEFDNGIITVKVQPDSQFDYGWDLAENLVVFVEWSVQPSGMDPGTLDLQISWYNTETEEWELLYEDTDASTAGSTTASKTADQCYNDSYQILASLAGATTIQDQKTLRQTTSIPMAPISSARLTRLRAFAAAARGWSVFVCGHYSSRSP